MIDLFRATPLARLFEDNPLRMVDIGARGGFDPDLAPAAWAVDAIGFEPEPEAHAVLAGTAAGPWRGQRHLPVALAGSAGRRALHVPPDPASASLLEHDATLGERFAMPHMFGPVRRIEVETTTLDEAAGRFALGPVHHLKLDVEGAELEILAAAPRVLTDVVSIKLEVSFLPFRKGQPLAWDIAAWLAGQGFELADVIDPARWRTGPEAPHPFVSRHGGYSRGQIAQCDFLFFRTRDRLDSRESRISAFLSACCHGYFDLAAWLLPEAEAGIRLKPALEAASRAYGGHASRRALRAQLRTLVPLIRSVLGGVPRPSAGSA